MSDLPAGRDLDALVAERVMGWTRLDDPKRWHQERGFVWGQDVQAPMLKPGCAQPTSMSEVFERVTAHPHYSTDIAAAWEVVGKLRETHTITLQECSEGWECSTVEGPWAQADTAPLAICRAALKAVEPA